jgi:hypothetical protein
VLSANKRFGQGGQLCKQLGSFACNVGVRRSQLEQVTEDDAVERIAGRQIDMLAVHRDRRMIARLAEIETDVKADRVRKAERLLKQIHLSEPGIGRLVHPLAAKVRVSGQCALHVRESNGCNICARKLVVVQM